MSSLVNWINNAVKAKYYMEKDKSYRVLEGNKIVPVDYLNTGISK